MLLVFLVYRKISTFWTTFSLFETQIKPMNLKYLGNNQKYTQQKNQCSIVLECLNSLLCLCSAMLIGYYIDITLGNELV